MGNTPAPRPGFLWRRASASLTAAALAAASSLPARGGDAGTSTSAHGADAPRVASRSTEAGGVERLKTDDTTVAGRAEAVARARKAIDDCKARYAAVRDYTCTLVKRERIDGKLTAQHVMRMKARSRPTSIYLRFQTPNKGREAIYVAGKNDGKLLAHDVGIGRLLAGTMTLDPRGSMAMEDCRHPITEAGIGALIDTVARHWAAELTAEETLITFHPSMRIGPHACSMIETVHPSRQEGFLHHKVRLYIDHEHGLPIRFEAYDWPRRRDAAAELLEEYTYLDLKTNVGLTEHDFDASNRSYSFGRF
jgi:hypothetical protein